LKPRINGTEFDGTLKEFCAQFKFLDRPVIDKTGIAGVFTIHLELSDHPGIGIPDDTVFAATGKHKSNSPALDDPADWFYELRTALRKIGLNLDATKGPQEIIVIDHVERPTGN
jgi:uncharacterized protein (TIGR03435 family)